MKKVSAISTAFVCAAIIMFSVFNVEAEEYGTDVSGYLGLTVREVLRDFPDFYYENDRQGSGRDFLTNGKVCFYYEYNYAQDEGLEDKRINRIVLNGPCGSDYRIGKLPGGSTYGDEYAYLNNMGYTFLYRTDDLRHFWMDDEGHLIIVTRGMYAGACETDYSLVVSNEFN